LRVVYRTSCDFKVNSAGYNFRGNSVSRISHTRGFDFRSGYRVKSTWLVMDERRRVRCSHSRARSTWERTQLVPLEACSKNNRKHSFPTKRKWIWILYVGFATETTRLMSMNTGDVWEVIFTRNFVQHKLSALLENFLLQTWRQMYYQHDGSPPSFKSDLRAVSELAAPYVEDRSWGCVEMANAITGPEPVILQQDYFHSRRVSTQMPVRVQQCVSVVSAVGCVSIRLIM
jgi:hypothetical protein